MMKTKETKLYQNRRALLCRLTMLLLIIAFASGNRISAQTSIEYVSDVMVQRQIDARSEFEKKILQHIHSAGSKRNQLLRQYQSMRDYHYRLLSERDYNAAAALVKPAGTMSVRSAAATTDYDRYVSTTGNDNNPGTQAAPFRTIQKAIDVSTASYSEQTHIKVEDGIYTECINVSSNFTSSGDVYINITGNRNNPNAVVIDGAGAGTLLSVSNVFLTLEGMKITGARNGNKAAINMLNGFLITYNMIITGNTSNRAIIGPDPIGYYYSEVALNNTLMFGNTVNGNIGDGIFVGKNGTFDTYNTTITDNTAPATIALHSACLTVSNSILYNTLSDTEIFYTSNNGIDVYRSNILNYTMLNGDDNLWIGDGVIDTEPGFVAPQQSQYQLADGSPCIDAGWGTDAHRPPAKQTQQSDMGAYGGPYVSEQPYQATGTTTFIEYDYDASGNQIRKELILVSNVTGAVMQSLSKSAVGDIGIDAENAAAMAADFPKPGTDPSEELLQDLKITVYPNPTRGNLQIDVTGGPIPEKTGIVFYNMSGSVIRQINQIQAVNYVDMSAYPSGVYVMRVYLGDEVSIWKIIKE